MLADLHHAMSVRSFRTTDLAAFVKAVLDVNTNTVKELYARIKSEERKLYLKNAYRVLLTHASQGMVIFILKGSDTDGTRKREWYDGTYENLCDVGIAVLRKRERTLM